MGTKQNGLRQTQGGSDLPLGDPDLDTPASEHRGKRIVIAIDPDQRLLGNPRHPAAIRLKGDIVERSQLPLMGQPRGRDTTDRAVRPTVHLLSPTV
jgi:hypothetical protein